MTTRPSVELRRLVVQRAKDCCEYCLIPQAFVASSHQVDHVIAEKHGGKTTADNLALSCMICNLRKGSDIASIDPETERLSKLFNPREMIWAQHFKLSGPRFIGLTLEGRTTAYFLEMNLPERLAERTELISAGVTLVRSLKKPK